MRAPRIQEHHALEGMLFGRLAAIAQGIVAVADIERDPVLLTEADDRLVLFEFRGHHHAVQTVEGHVHPIQLMLEVGLAPHLEGRQSRNGAGAETRLDDDPHRLHLEPSEPRTQGLPEQGVEQFNHKSLSDPTFIGSRPGGASHLLVGHQKH